ncbi:MAG TPA: hypothetical protein PKY81_10675 [bacterium]|nr:hypothetical protein [bacterium]
MSQKGILGDTSNNLFRKPALDNYAIQEDLEEPFVKIKINKIYFLAGAAFLIAAGIIFFALTYN